MSTAQKMSRVNFLTPIASHMGYAQMARLIWPALKTVADVGCRDLGIQDSAVNHGEVAADMVSHRLLANPDVTVINMIPPLWNDLRGPTKNIGYSTFETSRLPGSWTKIANNYDSCWTTSEWNRQVMIESGVKTGISVISPIAVGSALSPPGSKSGKFRFLASFQWGDRKNPAGLIRAFCAAFGGNPDVQLIIKSHIGSDEAQSRQKIGDALRQILSGVRVSRTPDIKLVAGIQSAQEIAQLTAGCHASVSLSHGEGWGLPMWEAAIAGRPVITTGWSAPAEWLGADYPYLVKWNYSPVFGYDSNMRQFFEPAMRWAEPQLDSAVDMLRYVHSNYGHACEIAAGKSAELLSKYSLDAAQTAISAGLLSGV